MPGTRPARKNESAARANASPRCERGETAITIIDVLRRHQPPTAFAILCDRIHVPADLRAACLLAALGLTLTGLAFVLGLGPEIGKALGAAG